MKTKPSGYHNSSVTRHVWATGDIFCNW